MVKIYKLRFTSLQQEILRFLFVNAGRVFNAYQLAKALGVSQPAVSKALPLLEKEGLIKLSKDRASGRWSIELNRDNPKTIGLKRADNLRQLYESGFIEFMYNALPGATVILFGSYALGEDVKESDIDIAVIGMKEKNLELKKFEKLLERKIVINYYRSLKEIQEHLRNNIINGITLKGVIEL